MHFAFLCSLPGPLIFKKWLCAFGSETPCVSSVRHRVVTTRQIKVLLPALLIISFTSHIAECPHKEENDQLADPPGGWRYVIETMVAAEDKELNSSCWAWRCIPVTSRAPNCRSKNSLLARWNIFTMEKYCKKFSYIRPLLEEKGLARN